jgi:DNA-binding NarL/FixJ family response regulator
MKKIRILLVDDHRVFLDGLEAMFRDHLDIEVVGTATSGKQALAMLKAAQPDVLVLDIGLLDMSGVDVAKEVLKQFPDVAILVLSMHGEQAYVRNLRDLGVHGYLLKEADKAELEAAIKALGDGREYFSRQVTEIFRTAKTGASTTQEVKFTKREMGVLDGLAQGWENQAIADQMGVEVSTVETHLKSIRVKTGLSSARALVKYAIDAGFGQQK